MTDAERPQEDLLVDVLTSCSSLEVSVSVVTLSYCRTEGICGTEFGLVIVHTVQPGSFSTVGAFSTVATVLDES